MDEGVLEKEFKVVVDKFEKGGWFLDLLLFIYILVWENYNLYLMCDVDEIN